MIKNYYFFELDTNIKREETRKHIRTDFDLKIYFLIRVLLTFIYIRRKHGSITDWLIITRSDKPVNFLNLKHIIGIATS